MNNGLLPVNLIERMLYVEHPIPVGQILAEYKKAIKALEEVRTTTKGSYEETAVERRKIAERALGYLP